MATVSRGTGPLVGMDRVRIDAASAPLSALARLRKRYRVPAILDLPGAGTRGVVNPLTTSELLVFASAENFHTVCLSGLTQASSLRHARKLLHPAIQLAAGLRHSAVIRESLGEICDAADVVYVDYASLAQSLGPNSALEHASQALVECSRRGVRCFLAKGLLTSLQTGLVPQQREIDRIADFATSGGHGFVLDGETACGVHAQESIDLLRSLMICVRRPALPRKSAARVAGRAIVSRPSRGETIHDS